MSLTPPTAAELRTFRKEAGLSQAALAAKLGASTRAVEDWEGERRQPPAMLRLALAALILNKVWVGPQSAGVANLADVEDSRLGDRDAED